ncbi:MAG: M1 family metallopeptidase [Candidatus Marsarchaeota archaeon]|nr:M1 family metallopeptidase [Candidatus Marsarchaeota archaeon]
MKYNHESLGDNVLPSRYELLFQPDLKTFDFKGKETIHVTVKKPTTTITLNAVGLSIDSASVDCKGSVQKARAKANPAKETLTLQLQRRVSGAAKLTIEFSGKCTDNMAGLYRSRYMENGKEKWILTTQFEAANARNAFPCFDQPDMKAVYDVSMLVDKDLQCISNMPAKKESIKEGRKLVTFHTTPKMSSYLMYLGVGNYDVVSDRLGKLKISVMTTPGKKRLANHALSYAKKFMRFFENYFGIEYPLPKMDLIAIPDFAPGAMENWGAITFRETALLAEDNASVAARQRIAEVVAHEFTHQWFGDLVTMKWWDDLWLNESFATFMSYKAMDAVFPEWNMGTAYIADEVGIAFSVDQLLSTHPIHVPVGKPSDVDQIFDEISYQKGGSVLNMLEDYIGKDAFRKGLHIYLKDRSYSNSEADDLWNALGKAVGNSRSMPIKSIANAWITKKGYPCISVRADGDRTVLRQKRFTLAGQTHPGEKWPIPVHYSLSPKDKAGKKFLMSSPTVSINAREPMIKLNLNQKGFFRTLYSEEKLEELGNAIKENELNSIDSWGIENDLYAFVKGCRYPLRDYLEFAGNYCFAAKYPLNMSVLQHLNGLYSLLYFSKNEARENTRKLLKDYGVELLKQVGWIRSQAESSVTTKLRSAAIAAVGFAGDAATIHKAGKLFKISTEGKRSIDPNLRSAVYRVTAFYGDKNTFNTFVEKYKNEEVPEEKTRCLQSLAMFNDSTLAKKALDFSMSDSVRYQDGVSIPSIMSSMPVGRGLIWGWTKTNWKVLTSRYPSGTHLLSYFVDNLGAVVDEKTLKDITSFFAKKQNRRGDITRALAQANEIARINIRFMKENGV